MLNTADTLLLVVCKLAMHALLQFSMHEGPRQLLLSTAGQGQTPGKLLQESSPSDFFWAKGIDGSGSNHLGRLLMQIRDELLAERAAQSLPSSVLQTVTHQ